MDMKIESRIDHAKQEYNLLVRMDEHSMRGFGEGLIREIVRQLAERFVTEHFAEIAAKLDPQAIANLSVAEAGANLSKTLKEKIPDKIIHHYSERATHTTIERGLFGKVKAVY